MILRTLPVGRLLTTGAGLTQPRGMPKGMRGRIYSLRDNRPRISPQVAGGWLPSIAYWYCYRYFPSYCYCCYCCCCCFLYSAATAPLCTQARRPDDSPSQNPELPTRGVSRRPDWQLALALRWHAAGTLLPPCWRPAGTVLAHFGLSWAILG